MWHHGGVGPKLSHREICPENIAGTPLSVRVSGVLKYFPLERQCMSNSIKSQ